ncbi:MAG: ribonuclease P protein component [Rickettsiales bacterium]
MPASIDTIKIRRDFVSANNRARKYVTPYFILQANKRTEDHPAPHKPRIGYTVTKKMGNAVIRNRIKRRLRGGIKQLPAQMLQDGYDYILISRHKAKSCVFSDLLHQLEIAFSRIHAKK